MRLSLARSAVVAGVTVAALGTTFSAAASASPTVTIKVSSPYAILGLTTTVTVTSSEAGTLTLEQVRPDKLQGPGRCATVYSNAKYVAGSTRTLAGATTVTYKVPSTSLAYFGGDLLAPVGWNSGTPQSEQLCWDQASQFNQLRATVIVPGVSAGSASTALTRVL